MSQLPSVQCFTSLQCVTSVSRFPSLRRRGHIECDHVFQNSSPLILSQCVLHFSVLLHFYASAQFNAFSGFAGSTADAFTLLERLEAKLDAMPGQLARASVELAKDWRTDKYLQKLEAMLIVTDGEQLLVITGAGDVLEPEHNVAAIGSGGNYALAAARGMMDSKKSAEDVARKAMAIAADICVYTNGKLTVETL